MTHYEMCNASHVPWHQLNPFLPIKGSLANSADPDQMPHNVASDQDLHYLLLDFPSKIE